MEFHKGGPAAEGRRPTFVEAAEGRFHYGSEWVLIWYVKYVNGTLIVR